MGNDACTYHGRFNDWLRVFSGAAAESDMCVQAMSPTSPRKGWGLFVMTFEVSANHFIEEQTRKLEREFHRSKPRPRNWAMGFTGRDSDERFSNDRRSKPVTTGLPNRGPGNPLKTPAGTDCPSRVNLESAPPLVSQPLEPKAA